MARTKSKKRLVGTWSTQQRREAMEQSREAAGALWTMPVSAADPAADGYGHGHGAVRQLPLRLL